MATNTNPFYTYSATAGSSKTLQKPQDGGDNNQWGNYINTDLDEIVSAVNALSDKIADASENTLVDFTATGSAVNHVGITNAATGNGPTISTAGTDSNVDLNVTPKGTGDSVFTNKIKVDDVIEKTTDHGVEIDGVTLKDGGGTFTGNVVIPDGGNIGSASDTDAIAIASDGGLTFSGGIDNAGTISAGTFNGTIGSSVRGTRVALVDQTVTDSELVAITLPSTSNVQRFVIQAAFYGSATDNVTLIIKNSSGTAFTCRVAGQRNWSDGSTPNNLQNNATSGPGILVVYNTPSAMSHANIILSYGSASTAPFWEATCSQYAGSYSFFDNVAAYATSSGIVTSVEFDVVGSSTITGNYKIYGIKT